ARGIYAVFHYQPLHLSPMGRRFGGRPGDCPVTEAVADRLVRLPFYADLSAAEQARVVAAVRSFRGFHGRAAPDDPLAPARRPADALPASAGGPAPAAVRGAVRPDRPVRRAGAPARRRAGAARPRRRAGAGRCLGADGAGPPPPVELRRHPRRPLSPLQRLG